MNIIDFLQKEFPDSSKRTLKTWIKKGRIELDGRLLRETKVRSFENSKIKKVKLLKREQKIEGLKVYFKDQDLIVVEKPAGVLSVNTLKEKRSIFDRLKKAYPKNKVYVIHRLDRETKGPLVFALNEETFHGLKKQFATKTAKRHYLAILCGSFTEKKGRWIHYLTEDKNTFVRVTRDQKEGKRAESHYHILAQKKELSLAYVELKTGRKNQIRVQAANQGCPILGDKKYGDPKQKQPLALHAFSLEFNHPTKKNQMHFFSKPAGLYFHFFSGLHEFLQPFQLPFAS